MWFRSRMMLVAGEFLFSGPVRCGHSRPNGFGWRTASMNRVLVYFDAVKFKGTLPKGAPRISDPLTGEFIALELPANYLATYQKQSGAEAFHLGDRYDLLTAEGAALTVTLTTLIGSEADEEVGNNFAVGAGYSPRRLASRWQWSLRDSAA